MSISILFDPGVHDLRNKGTVLLLQVGLSRLARIWPQASLQVVTSAPYLLRLYAPEAYPISPEGRYDWSRDNSSIRKLVLHLPRPVMRLMFELREEAWRRRAMSPIQQLQTETRNGRSKAWDDPHPNTASIDKIADGATNQASADSIRSINLLVATGGQYIADHVPDDARRVLNRIEAAIELGIPVIMTGQGFGPLEDPELCAMAKSILPLVDLIFVREKRTSLQLLDSLGVNPSRVYYTGDDAVELAYEARATEIGTAIGVGLRVAHYMNLEDEHLSIIRDALQQSAAKHNAKLIALPISHSAHELDPRIIQQVLDGYRNVQYGRWRFETPLDIIRRAKYCRLVVASTFHTALLALAQGIPAICLAKSPLYMDKFYGLADQFGSGCRVVHLSDSQLRENLSEAIDVAWESAESIRPQLLEAAAHQVGLGHIAYQQIFSIVGTRCVTDNRHR